jgi:hypothetical protein
MAKVSRDTASQVREFGPVTDRREEMEGYTVQFVSFAADSTSMVRCRRCPVVHASVLTGAM